jgi:hypothetical protein
MEPLVTVKIWISKHPVRIRLPQLQPHGSETTRPWGFFMRWRRECAAYSLVFKGFATLEQAVESLSIRRARPGLFTRLARWLLDFAPNSRSSLCLNPAGLTGVAPALSVPTYPGWPRSGEGNAKVLQERGVEEA